MTEHREDALTGLHRNRPNTWSATKVDRLRELWAVIPQLSCSAIATLLDVSRSAVIGKANRMKLPKHSNHGPAGQAKRVRRVAGPRRSNVPPRPMGIPQPPRLDLGAICELPPEKSDCAVDILGLTDSTCRWPIDKGLYCGAQPYEGVPYCLGHARFAYKPSGRP
jgi:GcrA cell cycle regulator